MDENLEELILRLTSPRAPDRKEAERVLLALGKEAIEPLRQVLHEETVRWWGVLLYMGLMGLTGALGGFLCGYASGIGFYAGLALVWCAVLHAVMAAEEWARPTRRDAAVRVLARMEDVRAVGALAEALEYRPARPGVQRALTRLLPAMTAQDASLLTEYQRQCLRRALERGVPHEEGDFLVAVLNLLERIGDTPAIPSVEMLLHYIAFIRSGETSRGVIDEMLIGPPPVSKPPPGVLKTAGARRVHAAALRCLQRLQDLQEREEQAGLLVRPSAAPEESEKALLRPASGHAVSDADLLLRPESPDGSIPSKEE